MCDGGWVVGKSTRAAVTAVGDEVKQRVETGCETGVAMLVICGKGNVRAAMMIESRTGRAVERVS